MILILSEQMDKTTEIVIDWLYLYKIPFIRINSEDELTLNQIIISNNKINVSFIVKEKLVDFDKINLVWCRRGTPSITSFSSVVSIKQHFPNLYEQIITHLRTEKHEILEFIAHYLEKKIHLNSFSKYHVNKLVCIYEAIRVGLQIPYSIITTSNKNLTSLKRNKLITKSLSNNPNLYDTKKNVEFYNLTRKVKNESIPNSFFPTLIQKEIQKLIEIRVFFLIDKCYSMAIFSQNDHTTSVDYRNYNECIPNRNCPFNLPVEIEKKISRLMKSVGLNTGSIDLILNTKGEYVFLEVNPVGQLDALSYLCNYNLEEKITTYFKLEYDKNKRKKAKGGVFKKSRTVQFANRV